MGRRLDRALEELEEAGVDGSGTENLQMCILTATVSKPHGPLARGPVHSHSTPCGTAHPGLPLLSASYLWSPGLRLLSSWSRGMNVLELEQEVADLAGED